MRVRIKEGKNNEKFIYSFIVDSIVICVIVVLLIDIRYYFSRSPSLQHFLPCHYVFYFKKEVLQSIFDNACLIEWSDKFKEVLPKDRIEIIFKILKNNSRDVDIKKYGRFKKIKIDE